MKATNLHIGAKCVGKGDLASLIETLHNGQHFSYIIAATWKEIWFEEFGSFWRDKKNVLNVLEESQWGRAFGEQAEVRWRKDEEKDEKGIGFLCRWIFEGSSPLDVPDAQSYSAEKLEQLEPQDQTFLLWGIPLWEDGAWVKDKNNRRVWYVTRIPRPLTYPIGDELAKLWEEGEVEQWRPLCLRVRFYLWQGQPMFDRFVKLEAHQGFRQGGKVDAG